MEEIKVEHGLQFCLMSFAEFSKFTAVRHPQVFGGDSDPCPVVLRASSLAAETVTFPT